MESRHTFTRGRATARWSEGELAEVVAAVLKGAPEVLWSADDVRERLAFGREGGGPAATSVREALARWSAPGASSASTSGGVADGATRPTRSAPRAARRRRACPSPRRPRRARGAARAGTRPGAEW